MAYIFKDVEMVHIKPRKGSRTFSKVVTEQQVFKDRNSSTIKFGAEEAYKRERWDDTVQSFIPQSRNGRFLIQDPLAVDKRVELNHDSSPESFKALNELVTKCKLKHLAEDRRKGEFITSADIFDSEDPFFTHDDLRVYLEEGEKYIKTANHIEYIALLFLNVHEKFGKGGEELSNPLSSKVSYIIVDKGVEVKLKKLARDERREAQRIFDSLSPAGMLKMALALEIIDNPDRVGADAIEDLLDQYSTNITDVIPEKITKRTKFVNTYNKGNMYLDAWYIFCKGKMLGTITYLDGGYQAFGTRLGLTKNESIEILMLDTKREIYEKLQASIKVINSQIISSELDKINSSGVSSSGKNPEKGKLSTPSNTDNSDLDDDLLNVDD